MGIVDDDGSSSTAVGLVLVLEDAAESEALSAVRRREVQVRPLGVVRRVSGVVRPVVL